MIFEKLQTRFPEIITDIRGLGLMMGIEVNCDPKKVISACIEKGLLLVSADTNVIRFVPPLIIEKEHIRKMADILGSVFNDL